MSEETQIAIVSDGSSEKRGRASLTEVKMEGKGKLAISASPEQLASMRKAFASDSEPFQNYTIKQVLGALAAFKDGVDMTSTLNAGLAIIEAVQPTNEMEAVLAAQMVAANHFAMLSWSRASSQTDMAIVQANAAMANKASRTFTMQMEALAKMRRGGEQVVRHVHVSDGGQAIVAGTFNASQGGGGG